MSDIDPGTDFFGGLKANQRYSLHEIVVRIDEMTFQERQTAGNVLSVLFDAASAEPGGQKAAGLVVNLQELLLQAG